MRTVAISARAKSLNDLLKKARRSEVILESSDGHRFVLASITSWEAFQVGDDDDITRNKGLMKHLSTRRSKGKRITMAEVKTRLGFS
ncbi:MAG: hypothetical protein L0387_15705 [Acidobacteria bacterium]|nr:hypothetical protein [Acidobacteriota bacterium]MCI0623077.1 hypothetical protein [Acidobacteriota bacterium]MCI0721843.1 hypothetical protein [Acidobacteriota bacterium]